MPVGLITLLVVAGLIFFGLAQRVLDRMRLTDKQALLFLGLIIVGSFINIPLLRDRAQVALNVGGAIVPVALAIYLLAKADSTWEWVRALLASAITAAVVFYLSQAMEARPGHPETYILDPVWLFSLVGGIVGYLFGRSRRAAFVAGTIGLLLTDVVRLAVTLSRDLPRTVQIGGAGAFDQIVLAGVIAVLLADLFGEARERLQGGPRHSKDRPVSLDNEEFAHELTGSYPDTPNQGNNETAGREKDDQGK